jgi:hypothetical protein
MLPATEEERIISTGNLYSPIAITIGKLHEPRGFRRRQLHPAMTFHLQKR